MLGLVVTEALFREFPQCSEGELTRLRSNLVSRKRMADMGVELGLGDALLMGKSAEQNGGRKKPGAAGECVRGRAGSGVSGCGRRGIGQTARHCRTLPGAARDGGNAGRAGRGRWTRCDARSQDAACRSECRLKAWANCGTSTRRRTGLRMTGVFSVEARLENEAGEQVLATADGSSKKEAQQRAAELALLHWSAARVPAERGER